MDNKQEILQLFFLTIIYYYIYGLLFIIIYMFIADRRNNLSQSISKLVAFAKHLFAYVD
jgi:hypothetical protein